MRRQKPPPAMMAAEEYERDIKTQVVEVLTSLSVDPGQFSSFQCFNFVTVRRERERERERERDRDRERSKERGVGTEC